MPDKVLLIDDDEITHIIGNRIFKITSFAKEIVLLSNGKEGIEYFENLVKNSETNPEISPDVIFLDINMPFMNGWDFLEDFTKSYHQYFPSLIIFMLSSSVDPEDIAKSKKYPIVKDYIIKPLTKECIEKIKQDYSVS